MVIIRTSARFNILSCAVYGIMMLAPIFALVSIATSEDAPSPKEWLLVILVFLTIDLFLLRMLLWFILGEETVLIRDGELIVHKKGTFLITKEKRIPLEEIKNVIPFGNFYERNSPSKSVGYFSRQNYILRIQNVGRIRITLKNDKTIRCLDNIDLEKAKEIASQIRQEIN